MPPPAPLYLDWTFWAAVLSLVAIVLSQLPPVHLLIRPKRLEVEVHSRIRLSHMVGNPNAGLMVSIRNTGGRVLRIKALSLQISRDGKPLVTLPAGSYHETPLSETAVLFVPFSLKPGDAWTHSVVFFQMFERQLEKAFRQGQSALNNDIRARLAKRAPEDNEPVLADPALVEPFYKLFDMLFIWEPGEYVATLSVQAEPGSASFSKKYRFTLYESDTQGLVSNKDDYKFGGGISYKLETHAGVDVPIAEHIG